MLAALLAASCSLAAAEATGASGTKSYGKHGVSFRYPAAWKLVKPGTLASRRGSQLWTEWFGPAGTQADLVMLSAYRTGVAVTAKNASVYAGQITDSVRAVAEGAGGKIISGPTRTRMGGLPGFGFRIRARAPKGKTVESRLVLVWKGKTEFFLNCQHTVGGTRKAQIERGCATIVGSFKAA